MPGMYEVSGAAGLRLSPDSLQKAEQKQCRDNAWIMRILIVEPGEETLRLVVAVTDVRPGHASRRPRGERSHASLYDGCSLETSRPLNSSGSSQSTEPEQILTAQSCCETGSTAVDFLSEALSVQSERRT